MYFVTGAHKQSFPYVLLLLPTTKAFGIKGKG